MLGAKDSENWINASGTANFTNTNCLVEIQPVSWEVFSHSEAAKVSTILAITVNALTMPFTVFFNALIIFVVWKNPSLQVERVIVLAYLALTDFLVGLVCQPLFIVREVLHLKNEASSCAIDSSFYFSMFLCVGASFYQLLLVTYERYEAIIHPLKYPARITVRRLTYAALGFGVLNTCLVLSVVVFSSFAPFLTRGATLLDASLRSVIIAYTIYCYVRIFGAIRKQKRQLAQQLQNSNTNNPQTKRQNHKGAMTAALLFSMFLLSFVPLQTTILVRHVRGVEFRGSTLLKIQPWVFSAVLISSVANPLIYGIRRQELRTKCLAALGIQNNAVIVGQNAFVLETRAATPVLKSECVVGVH